jgi:hypothetical protein
MTYVGNKKKKKPFRSQNEQKGFFIAAIISKFFLIS